MLNGRLALHELDDVEAVCASAIRKAGLELRYHEHEECLAYLVGTAWELSLDYERGDFPSRFGVYLARRLQQRIADWQRSRHGRTRWQFRDRTYERKIPELLSYEHEFGNRNHKERSLGDDSIPGKRLAAALDRCEGTHDRFLVDADAGGLSDLLGLQRARRGTGAGRDEARPRGPTRAAA